MPEVRGYRELAAELRQRIDSGEFQPGSTLPRIIDLIDQYGKSRQTVREAIGELADAGIVVTMGKGGTVVRNRTRVRIPLSRYGQILRPGGARGPWETACAEQGLDGQMKVVHVSRVDGPPDVAALLAVPPGTELVHRCRHAMIGADDVVQLQHAWYPADLASEAGFAGESKVVGGIFGALAAAGHPPATASERVISRFPSDSEATHLKISGKVPVLEVERITRGPDGRVLEVLRTMAPADRVELAYDDLPLE